MLYPMPQAGHSACNGFRETSSISIWDSTHRFIRSQSWVSSQKKTKKIRGEKIKDIKDVFLKQLSCAAAQLRLDDLAVFFNVSCLSTLLLPALELAIEASEACACWLVAYALDWIPLAC